MRNKNVLFPVVFGLLLAAFTAYVLLDTFVITRVYSEEKTQSAVVAAIAGDGSEEAATDSNSGSGADSTSGNVHDSNAGENAAANALQSATATVTVTGNSYDDGNVSIVITQYRYCETDVYVADVRLSSAEYLKTALAKGSYGKNVTDETSDIASSVNAIFAVNGDYYGAREKGYVIRNGVVYRDTALKNSEDLVVYGDGSFEIINESLVSAAELVEKGAVQVLSFGPALIENGKVAVEQSDEVGRAKASNPRTAIGIIDDLHYIFVVSDGRTSASEGLSLAELAEFMLDAGAVTAYNLDGGGSSTMYFNGQVVNVPTTNGRTSQERKVSDIVYIGI